MVPLGPRKSDAAMVPGDQVSRAEAIPAVSPMAYAAVDPQTASERGAQVIAGKPSCLGQSQDGSCLSFQLPKVRLWLGCRRPALPASATKATQRSRYGR